MRYPVLVVSDLHLTSKPADDYRWGLFRWMIEQIKNKDIKELYILGDITDAKDRHPSLLVNKLVSSLSSIAFHVPIKIIKGNHDYVDADSPFMEFLNNVPNIEFYTLWTSVNVQVSKKRAKNVLFLPHTRKHGSEWAVIDFGEYDFIFMHQTVNGSVAANGFELEGGMGGNYFGRKVYSGDVHVPQAVGNVEYIGAPYPIRFGDDYQGRALVIDLFDGSEEDLHYSTIQKKVLNIEEGDSVRNYTFNKGDMVKVRLHLRKESYYKWKELKRDSFIYLESLGVICTSIEVKGAEPLRKNRQTTLRLSKINTHEGMLDSFANKEGISEECLIVGRSYL